MVVTPGLQKHFDSDFNRCLIGDKLDKLLNQINPDYIKPFNQFRNKLLGIVTKGGEDIVLKELDKTEKSLKRLKGEYNIKLGASVIEGTEN